MLILVGVSISVLINSDLIGTAQNAGERTETAYGEEGRLGQITVNGIKYDSVQDYINNNPTPAIRISMKITGEREETVPMPDANFEHVEGTQIDTGYVIRHKTDGNEFVWIPVDRNQMLEYSLTCEEDITGAKLYDPYGDVILTISDEEIGTEYSGRIKPTVNGMYIFVATVGEELVQKTLTVKSLYAIDTWNDFYATDEYAQLLGHEDLEAWALAYFIENDLPFTDIPTALAAMGYPTLEVGATAMSGVDYKKYQDTVDYTEEVEEAGGFYIGRYEAGATKNRTSGNAEEEVSNIIATHRIPVSREGYYPYNRVTQGQAKGLAESMYTSTAYTDTLLTGAAWDRTVGWISETSTLNKKQLAWDSEDWGNFNDISFEITKGEYSEDYGSNYELVSELESRKYVKQADDSVLLTTGATNRNCVNNIYDLAGNCWEFTTEVYSSDKVVSRGGSCSYSMVSASYRYGSVATYYDDLYSFRPALYIN